MAGSKRQAPWSFPTSVVVREHAPSPGEAANGWRAFRGCLRWEFDFTCIYCGLRESDFGYRSRSRFSVDHLRPRKLFPRAVDDYANCYYACIYCNTSKGNGWPSRGEQAAGFRFFDPCRDVASEHFALQKDTIVAVGGSKVAEYTLDEVRNMNKDRTTKRRRREVLERIRDLIEMRSALRKAPEQAQPRCRRLVAKIDKWLDELYTPTESRGPCSCHLAKTR